MIKNAPLHQTSPNTNPFYPTGSPYLASHHGLFLAEIRITNMSEKNAVWMARNMVLFFPILSFHLTTIFFSFFFFALLLSYSYCKMSGIQHLAWNLTDLHFRQDCDNRFELDLPSLGTSSFICLFQRTRRVVAPDSKKGHLYIWLGSKREDAFICRGLFKKRNFIVLCIVKAHPTYACHSVALLF